MATMEIEITLQATASHVEVKTVKEETEGSKEEIEIERKEILPIQQKVMTELQGNLKDTGTQRKVG